MTYLKKDPLDWRVWRKDLYLADGSAVEGFKAIQHDNGTILGVHGDKYNPVQNAAVNELADIIKGESGAEEAGRWSVNNGRVTGIQLQGGTFVLPGDPSEYRDYFVLGNSFDGSIPVCLHPTQVRIVCQNTFYAALRGRRAGQGYVLRHTAGVHVRLEDVRRALLEARDDREKFQEWADGLNNTGADLEVFISTLIPDSESEREGAIAAVAEARDILRDIALRRDTNEGIRDTAWGILNAGVEYLDHFETPKRKTKGAEAKKLLRTVGFAPQKANRLRAALDAAL